MTTASPDVDDDARPAPETSEAPRARDADNTRQLLLAAARRRFALDGYSSTTVRAIADDAGVNVALIHRYFDSKEGLFEACLTFAARQIDETGSETPTVERIVQRVIEQVASTAHGEKSLPLLLLLRTSHDERADAIRRETLRRFSEGVAGAAGWRPGDPDTDEMLLRAQIAICTGLGVALLRSSSGLEPLASATAEQLSDPLREIYTALLTR